MSAYEDALRVAMEQGPGIYSTDTSALKVTKRIVDAFLAALPPSIVVDGKVVERGRERGGAVSAYIVIPCEHIDIDRMLAGNQCYADGCPGATVSEVAE